MARRKSSYDGSVYYTTFQVAKFLGVSLPTVVNWVNGGLLAAHRTPGGHRRIAHTDIIAFARDNKYPISPDFIAGNGRKRVLVVDDERDFADTVREYLNVKGGFEVEVAESGFQAGFVVASFKPDLILMDLMMPDMDGFEVYRILQSEPQTRHIPVIACTGYRDPAIDTRVREEGFDGLIEKPLNLEALHSMVKEWLGMLQVRDAS
jgi:excisionase family DNA binding protein